MTKFLAQSLEAWHNVSALRRALVVFLLGGLAITNSPSAFAQEAARLTKPNIVWILLDTCRARNLSCYGYERPTSPNLDKLARQGILFENHFAQATFTVPSVPSYMSGRYFPAPALLFYVASKDYQEVRLPAHDELLLPEILSHNGYETVMVSQGGVWFNLEYRLVTSFAEVIGIEPTMPPLVAFEELNKEAFKILARPHDKPFFLYIHAFDPHFPHNFAPPHDRWLNENYDPTRIQQSNTYGARLQAGNLFSNADKEYLRGLYDGSISYLDAQIGVLLEKMEELGLRDNTLFVVSSDHGEALGEDGKTVSHGGLMTYDEVLKVPLILAGPGVPRGKRVARLTQNTDIVPTIIEFLELDTEARTHGKSLLPYFYNENTSALHKHVFASHHVFANYSDGPTFVLRNRSFKYQYNSFTQKEELFPVPDRLATRTDVLAKHTDEAAAMRQILFRDFLPLWQAYRELPLMAVLIPAPKLLTTGEKHFVVSSHVAPESQGRTDGKWLEFEGQLFAASFAEKVPSLSFREKVKNGSYLVFVDLFSSTDLAGNPGSSIKLKLQGEKEWKTITSTETQQEIDGFSFVLAGQCEIKDGTMLVEIMQGDSGHWTGFKGLALVPRNIKAETTFHQTLGRRSQNQKELSARMEELKALGYIE
jgi:arylsulfatase A-like enzyme